MSSRTILVHMLDLFHFLLTRTSLDKVKLYSNIQSSNSYCDIYLSPIFLYTQYEPGLPLDC